MNHHLFFEEMYHAIWQGHDIGRIEDFYAQDFTETISVADANNMPLDLHLTYQDLVQQAQWQQQNYRDTTLEIRKLIATDADHIAVNFYSSSVFKKTNTLRHRHVCGIWRLNSTQKIDRVWAVVAPYYSGV